MWKITLETAAMEALRSAGEVVPVDFGASEGKTASKCYLLRGVLRLVGH